MRVEASKQTARLLMVKFGIRRRKRLPIMTEFATAARE